MPNSFAYVVLFSWPLVVFLLFRAMPRAQALVWSIIGGYLVLPFGVGINPPVLPTFDKTLIPALSTAVMCLLGVAPVAVLSNRVAFGQPEKPLSPGGERPFTRQAIRLPGRTVAVPSRVAQVTLLRTPWLISATVLLLFATHGLTYLLNTELVRAGPVTLSGLRPYDAASMMLTTAVMLLPFWLGWRYLGEAEAQSILLRVLSVAALLYTLPTLFEIRMSPQLARWTYGFLAQSFAQAAREEGFRPVVFLQHGLWLALFMSMAAMASVALWRQRGAAGGWGVGLWAALWLTVVLFFSKSLGAFALLVMLLPVILLIPLKGQLLLATAVAAVVLTYPMLRGSGVVPVGTIHSIAMSISEERAQSLKFRLDNEDILLERANQKPIAGWGVFGRSRVYDPETGRDLSVTDGAWVIVMGVSGWLGYIGTFGLLTLPVFFLFLRAKVLNLSYSTAGLCIILSANLIDMIANATLTPVTWLIAGALAGRCRYALSGPQADPSETLAARPEPNKREPAPQRPPPKRRLVRGVQRGALVLAFLTLLPALPARADVSSPVLSFGLSGVSDWSTQMPFLDLMKLSRPWIGHEPGRWGGVTTEELRSGGHLDADGWPMEIPAGLASIGTIWAWGNETTGPAAESRAGIYVLTYEGEGTLQFKGTGVTVLSSEPGRMVVQNLYGTQMTMNITATDPGGTGDYVRNISLVREEYVALHEAGQIFNPDWLAVVQDARELRFLNWMGTNGTTSASWEDRPQVGDVSWADGGVPVEVMVALANQTGTEPWFTLPAGADEAYIRNFATYVRDHLDPRLEVHVEYSNEMWNWAFPQTKWLAAQAKEVWGTTDKAAWLDYAAMLATKSALIWDDVFGADAEARVDNVMGTQTANAWIANRLLTAPLWQTMDPSGYVAPGSVFDSLAVTTYFGSSTISDADLRTELLAVLNTPGVDATAWLAAKLMDPDYARSIPQIVEFWAANKAVAEEYGLDLIAYEGGQHVLHSFAVAGLSAADLATLTTFLTGFVRSQAMAELYQELWTAWAAISDGPFMQFGDVAVASKYGAWGLFSALGDENPRAALLMDLNATMAPWFSSPLAR